MEKKGDILPTKWGNPNQPASADNSSALRKPGLVVPIKCDEVAFFFFFFPKEYFSPGGTARSGCEALSSKLSLSLCILTRAWRLIGAKKPK